MSEQDVDNATESITDGKDTEEKKSGTVKFESFDKVVTKNKKLEQEKRELLEKQNSYEREIKQREEQELAEKGEYKKLLDLERQKYQDLEVQYNSTQEENKNVLGTLSRFQKEQAVVGKLSGKIKKSKYFDYIDVDEVVIDPETGKIDEESASFVANKFAKDHPELIDTSHVGRLPNAAATQGYTPQEFRSVPVKDMRAKAAEAVRAEKLKMGI